MVASGLLRERDLRPLTAVVEDGLRDNPGEAMPWVVLDRLHQLVSSNGVQFNEYDLQKPSILTGQLTLDGGDRNIEFGDDLDHEARFWELREGIFTVPARACRRRYERDPLVRLLHHVRAKECPVLCRVHRRLLHGQVLNLCPTAGPARPNPTCGVLALQS
jgi:hypothetical protein